jgi:CRISPR-associated protein Cmr6
MTPNPFQRPSKPQQPSPSTVRPNNPSSSQTPRRVIPNPVGGGGNRGGGGGNRGGGGNHQPDEPSPWLDSENQPDINSSASFVEYLRWMRPFDREYKDATKVQIMQMAEDNADYRDRLTQLTNRTKLIAGEGNYFQVHCPWRIRVGGHRGPESILLPAFDALGMPYIPSSTLRGIARTQAIREILARDPDWTISNEVQKKARWKQAEKQVAHWFGSLEEKGSDRVGKVVFFDAYSLPNQKGGGLAVDMANNIWNWEGNFPQYSPNPNPFFSLKEATFLIGLRLVSGCTDTEVLQQVKRWLIKGLQSGIGSQINTGYGEMLVAGEGQPTNEFFRVEFSLEGQLIHGQQRFTRWNWNDSRNEWQMRGQAETEVRPVAFKSMLRYWFRTLALGGLEPDTVKIWEATLFGGINPKRLGWVTFRVLEGNVTQQEPRSNQQGKKDPCGKQTGILTLAHSSESPVNHRQSVKDLLENLTWLMFHLGGIGQGARRPCYSRTNRTTAPWYRGSSLIPESDEMFWELPDSLTELQNLFRQKMQNFYRTLAQLAGEKINQRRNGAVNRGNWTEAIDANCQIVVCSGNEDFGKPYALAVLHSDNLKKIVTDREGNPVKEEGKVKKIYDPDLCGKVSRDVKPSPVWIADLGDYQIVTVFGATQDPRQEYLATLRKNTDRQNYLQIWPLP